MVWAFFSIDTLITRLVLFYQLYFKAEAALAYTGRDAMLTICIRTFQGIDTLQHRIPDLTTSLVELLQYPGLDLPVTQELPMPRGVGPDLLPLVRQIQDQYLTELQRVNALCQQHSDRCIESLRKQAQQERPVTVWECSVHLDATQRKVT